MKNSASRKTSLPLFELLFLLCCWLVFILLLLSFPFSLLTLLGVCKQEWCQLRKQFIRDPAGGLSTTLTFPLLVLRKKDESDIKRYVITSSGELLSEERVTEVDVRRKLIVTETFSFYFLFRL